MTTCKGGSSQFRDTAFSLLCFSVNHGVAVNSVSNIHRCKYMRDQEYPRPSKLISKQIVKQGDRIANVILNI